ncbi:Mycocerosic acid synthase [Streptomonospora litoralis]|uniref:Mycocerosic acid synthase n=1 Tax=Streptomonospora litoralis TaxID=2498135 RepID=A0A4P6Q750_9ACTN|nr:Mycocerosic acid synthase [Streptomonospora litoralis]
MVGVGCRLPGGIDDLGSLWEALDEGRDLVGRVPEDRFESARFVDESRPRTGKSYTAAGGFLTDVAGFDADFFGISPKEAAHMDPQHRLLLEMTAEALDDAAIDPARLAGTPSGVFVGISDASYGALQMMSRDRIGPYTASGGAHSIAANRVSHAFDLRGPSMAVDTACSSSLVALERACCQVASCGGVVLAGGVNVLLAPYAYVAFAQAAMLSAKGRCAAFSADADGFVRSEGGGVVVLKRLGDALADGDRIHGVLAGWGSNSDGRTAGLALPNSDAQEELLHRVYADAGVEPDELVYMEAHGTGTLVGDPAECEAVGRALARGRSRPLPVGSVKSNVGHLEPASGMAGVFKALTVLRHGRIPASLHAAPLNPRIDFDGLGLAPAVEASDVRPLVAERRAVGVNSFGFGGANAHVIVAAAPEPAGRGADADGGPRERAAATRSAVAAAAPSGSGAARGAAPEQEGPASLPVVVSARTPEALTAAVAQMAEWLDETPGDAFYDLAYTSCRRRGAHPYRRAVLAGGPHQAAERLRADGAGSSPTAEDGRIAFVYCGNGSQWAGMGADLLAADADFARSVAEVDGCLAPYLGWSVAEEMALPPAEWRLQLTEVAQPLLFTVQVALTRWLADRGATPAAAVGHSVGEAAAAWAAGALTLDQAARVVAARGRAQAPTAGSGRMAAAGLSREQAEELLTGFPGVEIAGVNSECDVTLAGSEGRIKQIGDELERRGVFFRQLDLDYAFHSSAMDPVRETLLADLDGLTPCAARIPLASTATGGLVEGTELGAEHWWTGIREPVMFGAAADRLRDSGIGVFTEIGPHPVLRSYLRRCLDSPARRRAVTSTLDRGGCGVRAAKRAVESLIAAGADIDWARRYFPAPGQVVDLPAYPWQRERHWSGTREDWARASAGPVDHPLLGERAVAAEPSWTAAVEPVRAPWLVDHKLAGGVVFPAAGYLEMALGAGRRVLDGPVEADGWEFTRPLVIPWEDPEAVRMQTLLTPQDGATRITSVERGGAEPRLHARGRVRRLVQGVPAPLDVAAARSRCPQHIDAGRLYAELAEKGLQYGPAFQVLREVYSGEGEVLAAYRLDASSEEYTVHPALLDGAFHSGAPLLVGHEEGAFLPAKAGALRVWRTPAPQGWIRVLDRTRSSSESCWDIVLTDERGDVAVEALGLRCRRVASHTRRPLETHRTVLRAAPRAGLAAAPSPLPQNDRIEAAAADRIDRVRRAWHETDYDDAAASRRDSLGHAIALGLARLVPKLRSGEAGWADVDALGLPAAYRRAVAAMIPLAEAAGALQKTGESTWRLATDDERARAAFRTCLDSAPASAVELCLAAIGLGRMPSVMLGEREAVEMLTEPGTAELYRHLFATSPQLVFGYRVAAALLAAAVEEWPADRPLRVLEIGAGTAGFSTALVPLLPPDRTQYTFTDVSPFFFAPAQKQLAEYDFVEYRTLDLDADPAEQGFTEGEYDLVVAANALHTAREMAAALPRVASLLSPGGRLLAVENHDNDAASGVFGLLESFWNSADTDLRPDGAFIARDRWPGLLRRGGFGDVVQTGDDRGASARDLSVLLATAEHRAAGPVPAVPAPAEPQEPEVVRVVVAESAAELPLAQAVAEACDDAAVAVAADGTAQWADLPAAPVHGRHSVTIVYAEPDPDDVVAATTRRAAMLRSLLGAALPHDESRQLDLRLVTRPSGVHPAPEGCDVPADAAVWGMARTLANEYGEIALTRISLQRGADITADARRLAREVLSDSPEDEIVLTSEGRFVPRMVADTPALDAAESGGYGLVVLDQGLNFRVQWEQTPPPVPGPGMVGIEVRAAALNYRDVMQATGLLPAEAAESSFAGMEPGLECAGVVTAVGAGVDGLAVGDRVLATAAPALASHTVTHAHAAARIPEHMSFAEAATVPIAFTTVQYSLEEVARLRRGETVLVHGGAGAVGLAALQHARMCGAEVIATAGTEAKREVLRVLGVEHVLDSRSLEFASEVMELTGGRGVDVVLNSLAGEALTRSLEVLAPGGRFVELGKRDIMENGALPLRPFADNISFSAVDLSSMLGKEVLAEHWARVVRRLRDGVYRPLPHTVFPASQVQNAFAMLQHSRHIGKVVVAIDGLSAPGTVRAARYGAPPVPDGEGTYLVTGGLSGLGAATARHLAGQGARHLALVSRRGGQAPEAAALLADLADQGVTATAYAADCADPAAMDAVFRSIRTGGHPLRGVVHAAMALDDDDFADLTDERFATSLRPKMGGLAVVDAATRGMDLDLFWVYSSISAHVGNVRQSSYNAANLYTEAVVRNRRRRGEAGVAVAWGRIDGTGYVERSGMGDLLSKLGLDPVPATEALATIDLLHRHADRWEVAGVSRLDWGRLRLTVPATAHSARMSRIPGVVGGEGAAARQELIARLRTLETEEAREILAAHLAEALAEVLQTDAGRLDHHRRLDEYGVDSLMAADLLTTINENYRLEISPLEMMRSGGTISDIADTILLRIGAGGTGEAGTAQAAES